jgi:isopentenyl-diphosphate delta-isomerase
MRIPIVDEQDNILYHKDHTERDGTKEVTRTSALWLRNEQGEFLVSKRSKEKKYHPGLWSLSVTGTNEEGETYESNIIKEAAEELGVVLSEVTLGPKELITTEGRNFFVQFFFAKISKNTHFTLQESEVDEVRWMSLAELKKWFSGKPKEFSSHFSLDILEIKCK